MTNDLIDEKSTKYRVVARPSEDMKFPIKYVAQIQGYWGWWWDIDWSYDAGRAEEYITLHYRKRRSIFPPKFPEKVIKEITL